MKLSTPRFDRAPVLVVDDVMLDRYWHGAASRISPEALVPVVCVEQHENRPGGAANVMLSIVALGVQTLPIGVTSRDEAADSLTNSLGAAGMDARFQRIDGRPAIVKLRVMSRHQQLLQADFEEPFHIDTAVLAADVESLLAKVKVLVLSDYGKGALQNHQALIQAARACNIPILTDPKGKDFAICRGASLIAPDLSEFETVVDRCVDKAELVVKDQAPMSELDLDALPVTHGRHGMTLLCHGQSALHLPTRAREVLNVTGAGDTVIFTLAAALAAGGELPSAMGLANLVAGIAVGKLGTMAIGAPGLRHVVQCEQGSERNVLGLEQLLLAAEDAHAHDEEIAFTNDCLDILHAGHVAYLEQVCTQGNRLVIGVNDDASITHLKGVGRPTNPVDRRMAVLAGFGMMNWVVSFAEDAPKCLLEQVCPDVLVRGGDRGVEQVVGAQIVKACGGEVRVLGLVENSSITAIIEKIHQKSWTFPRPVAPGGRLADLAISPGETVINTAHAAAHDPGIPSCVEQDVHEHRCTGPYLGCTEPCHPG